MEARAESLPSQAVMWTADAACPGRDSFTAQLESFLGQRLEQRGDPLLAIRGVVRADRGRYRAELDVRSMRGHVERQLAHVDCNELTEASALVVALALEPSLVVPDRKERKGEPPFIQSQPPVPVGEAPVSAPTPAAPAPAPAPALIATAERPVTKPSDRTPVAVLEPESESELRLSIGAMGVQGTSVLPASGLGVGALAWVERRRFRVSVRPTYWLQRTQRVDGAPGAELSLSAWGIAARGCVLPIRGKVALALCAGPEVGDSWATGRGSLENPSTEHRPWSALSLELSLGVRSRSGLWSLLGVELGKVLERPRFGVRDEGIPREIFRAPGWMLNGFVGIGVGL